MAGPPKFDQSTYYALYRYGSRVYGTARFDSDWDFVGVTEEQTPGEIVQGLVNIKVIGLEQFQNLLYEHNITALECYFLPRELIEVAPKVSWKFKLDKTKLRSSVSAKASHSWVKAKKKFLAPYNRKNELLKGKKSLFHSLRILDFGIQIAQHGEIISYGNSNSIYHKIMDKPTNDWEEFQSEWKPLYNRLSTEFRTLAPKKS